MAAVAVATALHQETAGWECGRLCEGQGSGVPSSLVWVSVPASGSASSNAPGSLNGLSLQQEERSRASVHSTWEQRKEDAFRGDKAANHIVSGHVCNNTATAECQEVSYDRKRRTCTVHTLSE